MNSIELQLRTKKFALRIIKLADALPKTLAGRTIGAQIVRSGTSVAANYRASCRARSHTEFISKVGIVVEEADETCFWLEMVIEASLLNEKLVSTLLQEAREVTAIMTATHFSARKNKK